MFQKLMLKLLNPFIDAATVNMLSSKYTETPFSMISTISKLPPRSIMEAGMRAASGKPIERSLGSAVVLSPWDKLLLNSRQLFELPTSSIDEVSTATIIGPNCKKPMKLDMPIMITAMSLGGSLSVPVKKAIAMGSSLAGTSTNTGESNVTKGERNDAKFLIGQYNRAMRMDEDKLKLVDAIEIQFGQGAWGGSAEINDKAEDFDGYLRDIWHLPEGEDSTVMPRYPDVNTPKDIINLINRLKHKYNVPVGVKIAGTDFIEYDLAIIAQTYADFITIDGAEGGTSGAPPTLEDDIGLPTLYSLVRAVDWLEKNKLRDRFQIIITGGFKTPGEILKALAIGADAVYLGSIALIAMLGDQITKALPELPPTQLVTYTGKLADQFDVEKGAQSLNNFLTSCNEEIRAAIQVIGKKSVSELSREDLVTVDKDLAEFIRIRYAGSARI